MLRGCFLFLFLILFCACSEKEGDYVCTPCNLPCDTLYFKNPGLCPHCKMDLIKKDEIFDESTLIVNDINLREGSGVFSIEGGKGREEKIIKVYYHRPEKFSEDSRMLMVIPGAGRNGDSYRDAWIDIAERFNVLILSPMFDEKHYMFEEYHLCGLVQSSNFLEATRFIENSNIARLNEEALECSFNTNSNKWIFNDLDRIFDLVQEKTHSSQLQYDLFGHSAGGQILHRMALFSTSDKARTLIAANAGFYTLPDFETEMPFGIKSTSINEEDLKSVFKKSLILLIGEEDNEKETRGTLLRSINADRQGLGRLARGHYFHSFSKQTAEALNVEFRWALETVPNVGHNHRQLVEKAALLLY